MTDQLIGSFYQKTRFLHDGDQVYIRRSGQMFTRHYQSSGLGSGHYTDAVIGYWPELAERMWADVPGSSLEPSGQEGLPERVARMEKLIEWWQASSATPRPPPDLLAP